MDIRGRKMRKPPACVQCRKRKIGCDRVKPICGNCRKTNKGDCFFPDIPGRYVPAHSKGPSKLLSTPTPSQYSRDNSSAILHHNPELASLEQIREYNTRLQLLNNEEMRNSPTPQELAQFIPRSVPGLEGKAVSSVNDNALDLNWIQGPAIFDQMTTPYTQEEVVMKEIDFLKSRLLELEEITGKKIPELNLSWKDISKYHGFNDEDDTNEELNNQKKRKFDEQQEEDENDDLELNTLYEKIDEFRDLDPEFLDFNQVFSIFEKDPNNNCSFPDKPNAIFTSNFLVNRDFFLQQFYDVFNSIVSNKFKERKEEWEQKLHTLSSISLKTEDQLKFPTRDWTIQLINRYTSTVIESISLIPILNQNALLSYVEEAFANGSVFVTDKLELDVLLKLGELTILLLLTYESLVDTVLISFQDSQVQEFKQLKSFVPTLISNLQAIKIEIQKRSISSKSVEVLNFYALAKFYQSVTSYDLANINNMVDFDEDVHLAFQLSLNHENKDEHSIMIWNFIYKASLLLETFI